MENFADECTIVFSFMSFFSILIGTIGVSLLVPLGQLTTFFQEMSHQLHISETFFVFGLFWLVGLVLIVFYTPLFLPNRQIGIGKVFILCVIILLFFCGWFFIGNFVVYFVWCFYFLLATILGIILLPFIPFFIIGTNSIKQKPQNPLTLSEVNSDHDAIIVVDYINQLKFPIYGGGIDILINKFADNHPFRVYQISNIDEFKEIVFNPHAKNLWIFGHGARDRLSFGSGIELIYNELKDAPRKHFIAQLHCNHCIDMNCNKSLVDLIADYGCVSNDYRRLLFYRRDTRSCLKKYNCLINPSEKRIFEIFKDLKKDRIKNGKIINLIDKNRKLISTEYTINFQGDHIKKEIKYNPDFFQNHLLKYGDNVIRFILLHEEAHLSKGKNHLFLLYIPVIIILLISVLIMYSPIVAQVSIQGNNYSLSNSFLGVFSLIIMLLIAISASWRILWDSMYDEEINSDIYGAECIVDFFHENDPAKVAREFLMQDPTEKEEHEIKLLVFVMKIIGIYPDYHPSSYARIEKIREKFPIIYS